MFTKRSNVNEIADAMQRQLVDGAIDKLATAQAQLVKAADYLNAAAEIFDESGLSVQAEVVTAVLESLAGKKRKGKKSKPKAKAKSKTFKAPSSEKMVENLKHKGWVFDESKADDVDTNHTDDNCADVNCAEHGTEAELYSMLEDFKANTSIDDDNSDDDEDFEDEDDDFEPRVHDPFAHHKRTYFDDEEGGVSVRDPFAGHKRVRL